MNKSLSRLALCGVLLASLLFQVPRAAAFEAGEPCHIDLSELIQNEEYRRYVQMMVDYYLRNDTAIQETLEAGYSAVFLFEGCSDNMDDPVLSDLSYYRVSAVCVAVRLDDQGEPYLSYFNDACSTLPDRPLEYGAWSLEDVGAVGPATVCDGTYELYSVRHGGAYEALNARTSADDDKIPAVYMTPEGYVTAKADEINIHTRTGNHTIQGAMWSAGCILIGDGEFWKFTELMESTYYTVYGSFHTGDRVGTITINRQCLREEMYSLYENTDAVDMLLADSRHMLPQSYLDQCEDSVSFEESESLWTVKEVELMSLPCSNATDARSVALATVPKGEELEVTGSIRNTSGNLWYEVNRDGMKCYIFSGNVEEPGWFSRILRRIFL
ncbi:MAG: SH3 domain-containing protein [Faecousia sp.]